MRSRPLAFCVYSVLFIFFFSCKLSSRHNLNSPADHAAAAQVDTFRVPEWAKQSNVYEVNVRQYTPEGTFNAFAKHLPRLKEMGVKILWFMPITPISRTDRKGALGSYYAASDYESVNPEFGTLDDFRSLVKQAHDMGFKVITDWVANHTGADHRWLTTHPDFYNRDSSGKAMYAFDWSDTRELNYDNREMCDSMIVAMKFWLTQTGIDGFRCDAAAEVPTDFWKKCIAELRKNRDLFMLAEAETPAMYAAGFDATYPWEMYHQLVKIAAGKADALSIDSLLRRQDSIYPPMTVRLYFTSNHDENSWNKSDYGTFPGAEHAPFAVFTQTMKASLPLIYSGQEEPVLRAVSFFEKDTIRFSKYKRAPFYRKLLHLRQSNPALALDASFRKVHFGNDHAVYAYIRQKQGHKVLVILNLSAKEQALKVPDESLAGEPYNVFMGNTEKLSVNQSFNIEPWGYIIYDYDPR